MLNGENHAVDFDFLANVTGRATGDAHSPHDHLVATCGADGRALLVRVQRQRRADHGQHGRHVLPLLRRPLRVKLQV